MNAVFKKQAPESGFQEGRVGDATAWEGPGGLLVRPGGQQMAEGQGVEVVEKAASICRSQLPCWSPRVATALQRVAAAARSCPSGCTQAPLLLNSDLNRMGKGVLGHRFLAEQQHTQRRLLSNSACMHTPTLNHA